MTRDGTLGVLLQRAKQECPTCGAPAVWRVCADDHQEKEFCGCGWHYITPVEARPALTVEQLMALLLDLYGLPGDMALRDEAEWLLPRLAGPAQEGP